ncbi:aminodeoxychorismate synthase component I [Aromatoleum toluvorans]|uniref:Aminodeoxychorismate synthase component I n=1 Tax=Aromatoleum toluvorans TaxID=92002 RepID=A0ABX1Q3N2_9RHOO|nr:aminodeoxychorismate synthase component I [Aromatoleum toluvorans]NMG45495.1 aminodeoxychorismate synthase component I [Aromatoleum toluvorans]
MANLRFDFPADAAGAAPLHFRRPRLRLVAHRPEAVPAVLARADTLARAGEWVAGFVTYEAGAAFDPAFRFRPRSALPLAWFGVFDAPDAVDEETRRGAVRCDDWQPGVERGRYDADIQRILDHIRAGDVYQINHTIRLHGRFDGDPRDLYAHLRAGQPDGYCALLDLGRHRILSLSPELFFRRDGDRLISKPMKGTLARGSTPEQDAQHAATLAASEKNRAENLMIVDLIRNDLSRVARPHSVEVPELFSIETYPTVHQMTSTVSAELRADADLADIFAALFPCGSITGAPKIKAMEIIAGLEAEPRGIYCGAIGLLKPGGDAIFNVAIRTLALDGMTGRAEYGVGGGITADSVAHDEYEEMRAKARILKCAA